jgi:hypothetical protein
MTPEPDLAPWLARKDLRPGPPDRRDQQAAPARSTAIVADSFILHLLADTELVITTGA